MPWAALAAADMLKHDASTELCIVCEQIDFGMNYHYDQSFYHVGTLRTLMAKPSCPGCRLILFVACNFLSTTSDLDSPKIFVGYRSWVASKAQISTRTSMGDPDCEGSFVDVAIHEGEWTIIGSIGRGDKAETTCLTDFGQDNLSIRACMVAPNIDVEAVKHWINTCRSRHPPCKESLFGTFATIPSRLVDVQENRVAIVDSIQSCCNYLALSHVWGTAALPLLFTSNLSRCLEIGGLEDLSIPRTIFDAIQLTRDLGERYLWVDTLCIVQDDPIDKASQIPIMGQIFHHAELVIVAADESDSLSGLAGVGRNERIGLQKMERVGDLDLVTFSSPMVEGISRTKWSQRGWTFQEGMFSRRTLFFTKETLIFFCSMSSWREDINNPFGAAIYRIANNRFKKDYYLAMDLLRSNEGRITRYIRIVEGYAGRQFKQASDVVWACLSVLKNLANWFSRGFIWGLPLDALDTTLLWNHRPLNAHRRSADHWIFRPDGVHRYPFPSWSWLSITDSVMYEDLTGFEICSSISWHDPIEWKDELAKDLLRSAGYQIVPHAMDGDAEQNLFGSVSSLDFMTYGLLHLTAATAILDIVPCNTNHVLDEEYFESRQTQGTPEHAHLSDRKELVSDNKLPAKDLQHQEAAIFSTSDGHCIGTISVDGLKLNRVSARSCEFVELSATVREAAHCICLESREVSNRTHSRDCEQIKSYNIMLIEWINGIAYRRGLTVIARDEWATVEIARKDIILG